MPAPVLTEDARAIVLLCSTLGLPRGTTADAPKPLSAGEWDDLARAILRSGLQRPEALFGLFGLDAPSLREALGVEPAFAERLTTLLARAGQVGLEVARLADRGIHVLTRADEAYPRRLKQRLRGQAPPVLFYAGNATALSASGLAVAGSRAVDAAGLAFAKRLGERCAAAGLAVYSGLAPGVDITAMQGALESGGSAVGVCRDSLERTAANRTLGAAIRDGLLTVVTPFHPATGFSAALAMARNKYIYALADYAVVVASDETGGTWTGATTNLKAGWVPLLVRDGADAPRGNRALLARGATPFPDAAIEPSVDLAAWLDEVNREAQGLPVVGEQHEAPATTPLEIVQRGLFGDPLSLDP